MAQFTTSFTGSDLARRIAHRRGELGLSIEEVATRSGIDPGYLGYFERNASANLSAGTLSLIALTLQTSPVELLGGDVDRPSGHGRAGRDPVLATLTREQCEAHLTAAGVGRVVYATERGPVAVPVNFAFSEGAVIISTDVFKASLLESAKTVGFEIDRVDEALSEGGACS
jgi:transcriptional regulator with XRE-family HTH domain